MIDLHFTVHIVDWSRGKEQARMIREQVFVQEQKVPRELEWDAEDPECIHALALDADGNALGTARMCDAGHIGRMAVLHSWRGRGIGSRLLETLVEYARERGYASVHLNAQIHALAFYETHGFHAHGDVYLEAGIAHRQMRRSLHK